MSKRDEFITLINTLKTLSSVITSEQRKALLQQAVQQYDLSADEATNILNASGLTIDEKVDYFEVLGLSISDFENRSESDIVDLIEAAHEKLYSASLRAGGRPRADGKTEDQWRTLLNQARDTLIDPQKRREHLAIVSEEKALGVPSDLANPVVEFQSDEPTTSSTPDTTSALTTPSTDTEQIPISDIETITEQVPPNLDVPNEMVLIRAGEFHKGGQNVESDNTKMTVQSVYVDSFMIDISPVSNAQYKTFLEESPQWQKKKIPKIYHDGNYLQTWSGNNYPRGKAEHPVVDVSWYAAMAYSQWVGKRLPTESEWEKAARGGLIGKIYPWGDEINLSMANYGMHIGRTTPIGKYPPNGYGVYDIVGNVWEWCLDEYDETTPHREPYLAPHSIGKITDDYLRIETSRVLRGGSWASSERAVRVDYFGWAAPNFTYYSYGFRCVKDITP